MPTRYIKRSAALDGGQASSAVANAVFIDSDDDQLKFTTGASGTTTVDVVTESQTQTLTNKTLTSPIVGGDLGVNDDVSLELGTDDDSVLRHKSATNVANTALTDVLIGTPVTQATAANSLIISNVTASGDILIAANRGGASEEYFFADSSAGTLTLTGPGGVVSVESGTTEVLRVNSATVIEIPDSVQLTLGTDNDSVAMHKESTTTANTAVTGALIGTPVVQALAANSTIISNVTASGDILIAGVRGTASEEYFMADTSAGTLTLTGPGGTISFESGTTEKAVIDSTGFRNVVSSEVVSAANVITAAESGRVFFLNSGTEFASTLPAPALGLNYTFIVTAAPSGASYTVTLGGGNSCDLIAGHVLTSGFADSGSDVETTATGTVISFVDGVSVVGDKAYVISDGTSWFASCICAVEAGITITG